MDERKTKESVEEQNAEKQLQWHPAFYAGLQIELKDEAENLIFENEHQLGTKPKEVDVLIVKKEKDIPIRKNIGQIFRKHNIIEYKDPDDYVSIDDFYKVCGYATFYKSDTQHVNEIKIEELTVTFVCSKYPRKLIRHLKSRNYYKVLRQEAGIYYVLGGDFPIQIILTRDLSWQENMWLKSLTKQLNSKKKIRKLVDEYSANYKNPLYESVMDIVVQANKDKFKEARAMCKALEEITREILEEELAEEIEEAKELARKIGREAGEKIGREAGEKIGREAGEKIGREAGEKIGKEMGENRVNELIRQLSNLGRIPDILRAAEDKDYQQQLFMEFNL